VKKQKQAFVLQSLEDLNPLKPCGACNEWLKKIAESNPDFKVLTFTDAQCNGVYVSPCED
jgi:cytidine deaminase